MPLAIVGAAYPRTGTMSLKLALEELGFGPCYHMKEVIDHPEFAPLWMDAADGRPDWAKIFDGYRATVDAPGCYFWREIRQAYPDAKVILTERDPEKWFESVNSTVFSPMWKETTAKMSLGPFFKKLTFDQYGERYTDRDFMIGKYVAYMDEVRRDVPKDRLLVYRTGDDWGPLCEFLGAPVPDTAYPKTNSRAEMEAMLAQAARAVSEGTADSTMNWEEARRTATGQPRKS
jgi:hypothetical protein